MSLVEAADSLRDKAFIITLYESGARNSLGNSPQREKVHKNLEEV